MCVPAYGCPRVLAAIRAAGDTPRLIDVDVQTGAYDRRALHSALADRPKLLIVTHLFGRAVDFDDVLNLASSRDVPVVEDSALLIRRQALDPRVLGRLLSFGRGKPIPLGGGGALITTHAERIDESLAEPAIGNRRFGSLHLLLGAIRDGRTALFINAVRIRFLSIIGREPSSKPDGSAFSPRAISTDAVRTLLILLSEWDLTQAAQHQARLLSVYRNCLGAALETTSRFPGWRLAAGDIASCLAVRVHNRGEALRCARRAGFDLPTYWTQPSGAACDRLLPGATQLARELLFLPLHRGVTVAAAQELATIVRPYFVGAFS